MSQRRRMREERLIAQMARRIAMEVELRIMTYINISWASSRLRRRHGH